MRWRGLPRAAAWLSGAYLHHFASWGDYMRSSHWAAKFEGRYVG